MFERIVFLKRGMCAVLCVLSVTSVFALTACDKKIEQKGAYRLVIDYFEDVLKVKAEYVVGKAGEGEPLAFCFYPAVLGDDLVLGEIKVNDSVAKVRFSGDYGEFVTFEQGKELVAGDTVVFEYEFKLRECNERLGITSRTVNLGAFYPLKCVVQDSEPIFRAYTATGDPFFCDFCSYNIRLCVPSVYSVACGLFPIECNVSGEKTEYVYAENDLRTFAVCMSKEFNVTTTERNGVGLAYYYYDDDCAEKTLACVAEAVKFFSNNVGAYPYKTLAFAQSPYKDGGSEYSAFFVLGDDSSEKEYRLAAVHETAHQWFPCAVGSDEYARPSFDEGLAEFLTRRYVKSVDEKYYNELCLNARNFYEGYKRNMVFAGGQPLSGGCSLDKYSSKYEYAAVAYGASSLSFEDLCASIGEDKTFKALSRFYEKNLFSNAFENDFFNAFDYAARKKAKKITKPYV